MSAINSVTFVACVQTITKLWLVPSAKQRRDPCSGPPTDSTNYRKCVSNSLQPDWRSRQTKQRPFLTGQSWRVLKSGYTAGSLEQAFRRCFADGVNQSLVSSARRLHFLRRSQVQVLDPFDTQLMNFIRKYFHCLYSLLNLQYKFTVQRVNKASFFEVTTSRSCEAVNGFHNVTFCWGGKATISCSVFR